MREEDIRPVKLRKKCEKLFEKDARILLRYKDEFVEVGCPACGLNNKGVCFLKKGYTFKKCGNCRTYYISPRPHEGLLKMYYSTSNASKFWQEHFFPHSEKARIEHIYKPRADLVVGIVKKYVIGNGLLVDIGAGSGFFGREIASRGVFKKVTLIEPGPIKMESDGIIDIINDSFENVDADLKPDIVTNFELIEHLFSPKDFLEKVHRLMHKGTYFVFTTPNIEGFELFTIFDKSINVAGPDHLNYFNIDSIRVLLGNIGFRDIAISTPGELDVDIVINKHKEGLIDLKDQAFLYHVLIEKERKYRVSFQDFLKRNKLSSSMLVTAKK